MMAGGAAGDVKPVDPVGFRDLQALFPDLDGWEKGKPEGERMTQPVSFSQAEVRYTKGDSSISLKIVDSGFNQLRLAPFAMFLTAGYEKRRRRPATRSRQRSMPSRAGRSGKRSGRTAS
jgi:hypothetical protein